jgi:hypothetical protein
MNGRGHRLRLLTLFASAAAGLVGAHLLGYLVVAPGDIARSFLLTQTGHGYLSRAITLAVASAIVAGLTSALLGVLRASRPGWSGAHWPGLAVRLSLLQVAGFLALETAERLLAGAPLADLGGPVLAVGVPLQVVVAMLGAAVLALIDRAAAVVTTSLGGRVSLPGAQRSRPIPIPADRLPSRPPVRSAPAIRAPPSLLTEI